jgi:hypothetical protein
LDLTFFWLKSGSKLAARWWESSFVGASAFSTASRTQVRQILPSARFRAAEAGPGRS